MPFQRFIRHFLRGKPLREIPRRKCHARVTKFSSCETGLKIFPCNRSKVSTKSFIWPNSKADRQNCPPTMSSEAGRVYRGPCNAGPYPLGAERSAKVQHCNVDRLSQRQVSNSDPSPVAGREERFYRKTLFVPRLVCEYGRIG